MKTISRLFGCKGIDKPEQLIPAFQEINNAVVKYCKLLTYLSKREYKGYIKDLYVNVDLQEASSVVEFVRGEELGWVYRSNDVIEQLKILIDSKIPESRRDSIWERFFLKFKYHDEYEYDDYC